MQKIISCVLSLLLFVQVVAADNVVYSFNGTRAQVVTVNSDGTNAQILLRGRGGVTGITYDGTGNNICWSETQSQRIVCSKTDGSDPVTVVSGLEAFRDLVVGPSSKIYFVDNNSVKRVNIDGTGLETLVAGAGTLSGIDVEGTNIFYFDDASNTLYRSNLDGTGVTSLATIALFTAADIEVNATHIFLVDSSGTIKRANIDGTGAADFITGLTYPAGLEIDATNSKLLFTDSGTREVLSANLADGSGITTVIDSIAGPRDIAVVPADNLLFVLDAERQSIYRSALSGAGLSEIVTGSPTDVGSIAFDDETGDFYNASERPGQIVRYNNDGTNETVVLSGLITPIDLEVFGGKIYYVLGNPDSIGRANIDGSGDEIIIPVAAAGSIAINGIAEELYWAESSTGNIYRTSLSGTGSTLVTTVNIAPTVAQPRGMVYCPSVDKLFVTEGAQGKIWSVPTDGTAPTAIVNTASSPFQIQCDDVGHKLYWVESANTIKRANFDGTSVETVADVSDSVYFPKAIGLAFDADSDGTLDAADACDSDAAKIAAGICGCGTADTDSDSDGTANCLETCDNDPEKTTAGVCGCGVEDVNSDGDSEYSCEESCDEDSDKLEPGVCGCGIPDDDLNANGLADNCQAEEDVADQAQKIKRKLQRSIFRTRKYTALSAFITDHSSYITPATAGLDLARLVTQAQRQARNANFAGALRKINRVIREVQ